MKQFFLLVTLFTFLAANGVQAQSFSHSKSTAIKAAVLEDNISQRFDEATGQTIYVRKKVCATSGKVSYIPVEYCSKSGKFVNVSPLEKQCVKSRSKCTAKAVIMRNGEIITDASPPTYSWF